MEGSGTLLSLYEAAPPNCAINFASSSPNTATDVDYVRRVDPDAEEARLEYREFIKKLDVPPRHMVPERLTYEDVVVRAISRADLQEDVRGINESLEIIRRTRGGAWPSDEVTEEFNFVDLVWHEAEFRDGGSYTYAAYDTSDRYLGCCYLYPMGRRTQLTEDLLKYDVDVSWWVTPPAYEEGYYTKLYRALGHWLEEELPFKAPYYSNREIPAD